MSEPSSGAGPVAVVGMAAVFPGSPDLRSYWQNICDGVDATSEVPPHRIDPLYFDSGDATADPFACRRGGFVDDHAWLDPADLGVAPAVLDSAEPDQLLALALATDALRDAGAEHGPARNARTAVVVGRGGYMTPGLVRIDQRVRTSTQLVEAVRTLVPSLDDEQLRAVRRSFLDGLGPDRPAGAIDLVPNLAASRIANRLDLHGPAYTVDAACASALVALDHCIRELATGRCDRALAGAVHLCQDVTLWSVFHRLGALSPSECIRPFDRRADGLLIGEGGAMLVLERLDDAERNGSRVYAVLRGTGIASDGRGGSLMRPSVDGQVLAVERAWAEAGRPPADVGLLEAHGTGMAAGDAAELETVRRVFGPVDPRRPRAVIGSVKSMIGHAMPAAGAAGLVKAVMAVHRRTLPPTLHCEEPLAAMSQTRFRPAVQAEPWDETAGPRLAAVQAFGFGGINAHIVIEEHDHAGRRRATTARSLRAEGPPSHTGSTAGNGDERVLLLSAETPGALLASLEDGAGSDGDGFAPAGSGHGPVRLALVDPTPDRISLARTIVNRGVPWRGRKDVWFTADGLAHTGSVALVFPGVEPVFEPRVDDVAAHFGLPAPAPVAADAPGTDLEGLGRAIIGVGRVLDAALRAMAVPRDVLAGQSIGEWSAMIASEMIPAAQVDGFIDSIRPGSLVVPGVAFAAVGTGVDAAADLLGGLAATRVSHDNCPHQTIVCGPDAEVDEVVVRARARRILAQRLPFRSGFHSPLFTPFLRPFEEALARLPLQPPTVPVWSATTCTPYPDDQARVRELALAHLVRPVRFRELVLALHAAGARVFVQVGGGGVTGMVEDTLAGRPAAAIAANVARRSGMAQLLRVGAALWVEGVDGIRWDAVREPRSAATGRDGLRRRPLPLGSPLVRLQPLDLPPRAVAPAEEAHRAAAPSLPDVGGALGQELVALWQELQDTAGALVDALATVPADPRVGTPTAPADPRVGTPTDALATAPTTRRDGVEQLLSVDTVPALSDHCLYRQPPGWPSMADRFPVVPMTMMLELMVDAARSAVPATVAVAVEDVVALRWLAVAPPVSIRIVPELQPGRRPDGTVAVRVAIDGYARGTVLLAGGYPAAPQRDRSPLAVTDPVPTDPHRIYEDRWLFHGPAYRGIASLGPMGPDGIDGTVVVGDAPGAPLDNAGQLMGFWVIARHARDRLALPVSIRRVSWFGPRPASGERLDASVRVRRLTATEVEADLELSAGGRTWARAEGWVDRRFETDEVLWRALTWPERSGAGEHHGGGPDAPAGWMLAHERWESTVGRELMMRRYLSEPERRIYDARSPRAQRLHLLGRVAAKDAGRHWWWSHGGGDCFPVEVEVSNDPDGRPWMRGPWREHLQVSIAHTPWAGAAMVADSGHPGIDVEGIEPRPEATWRAAFGDDERAQLLEGRPDADGLEWLTRGWAAKEAVAKSRGTGLLAAPRRFAVTAVEGESIVVDGQRVATSRKEGLAVAWTVRRDG